MPINQSRQNNVPELSRLPKDRYENIFNVYISQKQDATYYFYNILKKVTIDTNNIDPDAFKYIKISKRIPWTTISYQEYQTQHLWWLVLATNKKTNPIILPQVGDVLRIIRSEYIEEILGQINKN